MMVIAQLCVFPNAGNFTTKNVQYIFRPPGGLRES